MGGGVGYSLSGGASTSGAKGVSDAYSAFNDSGWVVNMGTPAVLGASTSPVSWGLLAVALVLGLVWLKKH